MKKHFTILIVILLTYAAKSQDIVYGTVRYDGFKKITKGAFWKTRPEAKMVYEGGQPPGVEVYTLEDDYFVRFAGTVLLTEAMMPPPDIGMGAEIGAIATSFATE